MENNMQNKIKNTMAFVVPKNDAEAVRIGEILTYKTNKEVKVLVTAQTWGASWENLEKSIKEELETLQHSHQIYGVELKGTPLFSGANIDHHYYDGDDRSNEKTSLEQVAELIGYKLSLEDMFISANDKAYIPGMYALGEALAMSQEEIAKVGQVPRTSLNVGLFFNSPSKAMFLNLSFVIIKPPLLKMAFSLQGKNLPF